MNIKKLPEVYKRSRGEITNKLLHRTPRFAVYQSTLGDGTPRSFEVGRIELRPPYNGIGAKPSEFDKVEHKWTDEDFGKLAWTYPKLEQAMKVYEELVAGGTQ